MINMNSLHLLVIVIAMWLQTVKGRNSSSGPLGSEHRLIHRLLQHYSPDSRPVRNASDSVTVTFALGLNQLLDLDEKHQILSTSVWIYEKWKDEQLVWSPDDYENRTILMIPASVIWLPDVFIFNAAGETADGFVRVNGSKVAVQSDGTISWMVPLMIKSACTVDVTYFPYDRQTCFIKFISWIYDLGQLDLVVDSSTPDMDQYVMNSEYDLENVSISRGIVDSSCCPGDGKHSMVQLKIRLKRKSLYYDYIVIAPTIMLCVLTLVSFLLPCDKGEKIAIGLNVFLTLYVLQLRIAENVPDTNYTPILGVFMLVVMTFNCISLIMATLVMNVKKRGDATQCTDVPAWLFSLCAGGLGRVVCTRWRRTEFIPLSVPVIVQQETTFDGPDERDVTGKHTADAPTSYSYGQQAVGEDDDDDVMRENLLPKGPGVSRGGGRSSRGGGGGRGYRNSCVDDQAGDSSYDNDDDDDDDDDGGGDDDNMMMRSMRSSRGRRSRRRRRSRGCGLGSVRRRREAGATRGEGQGNDEGWEDDHAGRLALPWRASDIQTLEGLRHVNLCKRRWFYVAEVVDKFAFLVYLVLLTISIFTVLYLIPVHFRND